MAKNKPKTKSKSCEEPAKRIPEPAIAEQSDILPSYTEEIHIIGPDPCELPVEVIFRGGERLPLSLYEKARDLFEGDVAEAIRWLYKPVKALGYITPLEAAKAKNGVSTVEGLINQLEHGVFS